MEEKLQELDGDPTCNGLPKPAPKEGEVGDWQCEAPGWIWVPAP